MRFRVGDLQRELNALDAIASRYLARGSRGRLKDLADSLGRIRRAGGAAPWQVDEGRPLETEVSAGAYQTDGDGSHHVYAQISWVWDVRPIDDQVIEVYDRASTRVTLQGDDVLAVLSMDLGDTDAPGCFFHVQVSGGRGNEPPLPKDLDVPRFPTLVATPASVVEFILSELFQGEWGRHASAHAGSAVWISSQRRWWRSHLEWQRCQVDAASYSPWVELKRAIPDRDLFC